MNLEWYDFLFMAILAPFALVGVAGFVAALIYAYNIAVLIVKIALGDV